MWKNWQLEKYVRKRWDWKGLVKDQERELFPPPAEQPGAGSSTSSGRFGQNDRNEAREMHNRKHGRDSSRNTSDRSRKRTRHD